MNIRSSIVIIFIVLITDQLVKFYVKTHFSLGEFVEFGPFIKILFVENAGMAWGSKISDFLPFISEPVAKVILTIFRVFAIGAIAYWLFSKLQQKSNKILLISLSMILAGAIGNILDSLLYNYIFDKGTHYDASLNGWVGYSGIAKANFEGYGNFMQGCVVDMFQFFGNTGLSFFNYVFNIADASITIGVLILLFFHKKAFPKHQESIPTNTGEEKVPLEGSIS